MRIYAKPVILSFVIQCNAIARKTRSWDMCPLNRQTDSRQIKSKDHQQPRILCLIDYKPKRRQKLPLKDSLPLWRCENVTLFIIVVPYTRHCMHNYRILQTNTHWANTRDKNARFASAIHICVKMHVRRPTGLLITFQVE